MRPEDTVLQSLIRPDGIHKSVWLNLIRLCQMAHARREGR